MLHVAQRGQVGKVTPRWSPYTTPMAWGGVGFLIGASFWHALGVWGVLGAVVLTKPEASEPIAHDHRVVVTASLPNCTDLALDRTTGQTRSVPCAEAMPLLEEARHGRQDLALAELQPQGPQRLSP